MSANPTELVILEERNPRDPSTERMSLVRTRREGGQLQGKERHLNRNQPGSTWAWMSSLQHCETINLRCWSHAVRGSCVMAALADQHAQSGLVMGRLLLLKWKNQRQDVQRDRQAALKEVLQNPEPLNYSGSSLHFYLPSPHHAIITWEGGGSTWTGEADYVCVPLLAWRYLQKQEKNCLIHDHETAEGFSMWKWKLILRRK